MASSSMLGSRLCDGFLMDYARRIVGTPKNVTIMPGVVFAQFIGGRVSDRLVALGQAYATNTMKMSIMMLEALHVRFFVPPPLCGIA